MLSSPTRGCVAVEPLVPKPTSARTFSESRRIRLSEMDAEGRLRLDSDRPLPAGRRRRRRGRDRMGCSGAPLGPAQHPHGGSDAVARRPRGGAHHVVQRVGDGGGRQEDVAGRRPGGGVELDSVWIHLGPDAGPARIEGFGVYAESADDRTVSTRLELTAPPSDARRRPWETRASDIDLFGHVNNAVYWQGVEGRLRDRGIDPPGAPDRTAGLPARGRSRRGGRARGVFGQWLRCRVRLGGRPEGGALVQHM